MKERPSGVLASDGAVHGSDAVLLPLAPSASLLAGGLGRDAPAASARVVSPNQEGRARPGSARERGTKTMTQPQTTDSGYEPATSGEGVKA